MDRSEVITLVGEAHRTDDLGVVRACEPEERDVFANVQSVTGAEWFDGARNGLNPELRFTLFKFDYQGEQILRYHGTVYQIYRTYERRTDELELYCEKRKGPGGV